MDTLTAARPARRHIGSATLVAAIVITLGGCSDDNRSNRPVSTDNRATASPSTEGSVAATPADPTVYCQTVFDLTAASDEDLGITPEEASMSEIRAATRAFYGSERAEELMDQAVSTAPAGLLEETETLVDGLRTYAADGDLRAASRRIGKSQQRIDRFLEQECPEVIE